MRKLFWTIKYHPFVMGGRTHRATGCEIPCIGPYALGEGYEAYVGMTPKGNVMIAEKTTGAIVGDSIAQVREDIVKGDPEVMAKQVSEAREMLQDLVRVKEYEFYEMIDRAYENSKEDNHDEENGS